MDLTRIKVSITYQGRIPTLNNITGPCINVLLTYIQIKNTVLSGIPVIYHSDEGNILLNNSNVDFIPLLTTNELLNQTLISWTTKKRDNVIQWFYVETTNFIPHRFVNLKPGTNNLQLTMEDILSVSNFTIHTIYELNNTQQLKMACTVFGEAMIEHDGTLLEGSKAIPGENGIATVNPDFTDGYPVLKVLSNKYAIIMFGHEQSSNPGDVYQTQTTFNRDCKLIAGSDFRLHVRLKTRDYNNNIVDAIYDPASIMRILISDIDNPSVSIIDKQATYIGHSSIYYVDISAIETSSFKDTYIYQWIYEKENEFSLRRATGKLIFDEAIV